jgi:hypothetical protein
VTTLMSDEGGNDSLPAYSYPECLCSPERAVRHGHQPRPDDPLPRDAGFLRRRDPAERVVQRRDRRLGPILPDSAAHLSALAADFRLEPIFLLTNRTLKILALMRTTRTTDFRSVAVPSIMYGTAWKEDRTQALTLEAIATGFRAFDTANQRKHYVEEGVGAAVTAAIASGIVRREDLFLQTKFTYQRGQDHRLPYNPDCNLTTQVRQSIASSLEHLSVTRGEFGRFATRKAFSAYRDRSQPNSRSGISRVRGTCPAWQQRLQGSMATLTARTGCPSRRSASSAGPC